MIDSYKDMQDVLSVAGFTQNGLQAIDHRGQETRPLQQGRAYLFDGINDIGISGVSTTFETATNQFSLLIDLQLTNTGSVFNKAGAAGGFESYIFRYTSANTMQLYFDNGTTNWVGFNIPVANLASQLNRIVARWSNTTGSVSDCRAWVNGSEVSVTIGTISGYTAGFNIAYLTTQPLAVGGRRTTTGVNTEFMAGSLDNIFVWNTALSVANCIRLSDRTKPILSLPNIANLMFGYKCDEGDGILGINCLGLGGNTDLVLNNIVQATFHQQRTDGYGADWQNQFGCTPSIRFNPITNASGINLGNGANAQIVQHQAFTFHTWINLPDATGHAILSNYFNAGSATQFQFGTGGTNLQLFIPNIGYVYNGSGDNIIANTWVHVAWVRENTGANGCKMYIQGNFRGRFTYANTVMPTSVMYIGTDILNAVGYTFNGRMQNICFVPSAIWTESGATIGNNIFTPPTTWANYEALELTNPSKLAIYTQNIVKNPLNLPITFTDATSLLVPRNENNISLDAFGRPLFFQKLAKNSVALRQSNCLTFDGVNDVVTTTVTASSARPDFTFSIWANFTRNNTQEVIFYSLGASRDITIRKRELIGGFANTLELDYIAGTPRWTWRTTQSAVLLNQWALYTFRKQGTTITILVNGVEQPSALVSGTVANVDFGTTYYIGRRNTTLPTQFQSVESRLYLRALSNLEISNLYKGIQPATTNLVLHFPMQEGSGNRVFSKVSGYVGVLNNFSFPTAWASKQDVVNGNLIHGFDKSFYTDGITNGQRLTIPAFTTTADYTIDFWYFKVSDTNAGNCGILESIDVPTLANFIQFHETPAGYRLQQQSAGVSKYDFTGTTGDLFTTGAWVHFELCVSGTTVRIFKNGVFFNSLACTTATTTLQAPLSLGALDPANNPTFISNGYYSNVRWATFARHTTNTTFTPPTTEADYADLTNLQFFIRGDIDVMGLVVTNNNAVAFPKRPITATNPQTVSNPAGTWHNGSEVVVRQPLVPALIRLDILNTFFTGGVANALAFANLPNNVSNLGKITCKTSVANRRSNLKVYRGFN